MEPSIESFLAVGERVTSRRLVLLFFLIALVAWQCSEFLLLVPLLSLSARHLGKMYGLFVIEWIDQLMDGGGRCRGMKLRGRLWERAEAPKKGLRTRPGASLDLVRIGEPMMIPPLHCRSQITAQATPHH